MARKHHPVYEPSREDRELVGVVGRGAVLWTPRGVVGIQGPDEAVPRLVSAVYEAFPRRAHELLRRRILCSEPPTELDRAVVRVAAKRLTGAVEPIPSDRRALDLEPWARRARARARRAGVALASLSSDPETWTAAVVQAAHGREGQLERPLARRDRPVVAALVGPTGEILAAARNVSGRNRVLHAEINLLYRWGWPHRRLPEHSLVVTSLQPCRMCAAALARAATRTLIVWYAQRDPGRLALETALQRGGAMTEHHRPPAGDPQACRHAHDRGTVES